MRIAVFSYLIISILLIACGEKTLEHKILDNNYLYGIGEGDSFALAKENALKDLVLGLRANIKYTSNNNIYQNNNALSTIANSNVFIESSLKDISGIEVDSIKKQGKYNIVKVKIAKNKLHTQISQKVELNKERIDSKLDKCGNAGIKEHATIKRAYNEMQTNFMLLQGLGLADIDMLNTYSEIAESKPTYNLAKMDIESNLANIIERELSKFVTYNPKAKSSIKIALDSNSKIMIDIRFYNCEGNLEDSISIATDIYSKDLNLSSVKTRLGAVIYKAINEQYKYY